MRKVRVARAGSGKSNGYRIVYVFAGKDVPVIAVTMFAKNEKANLSRAERTELVALSKVLVSVYGGNDGRGV